MSTAMGCRRYDGASTTYGRTCQAWAVEIAKCDACARPTTGKAKKDGERPEGRGKKEGKARNPRKRSANENFTGLAQIMAQL